MFDESVAKWLESLANKQPTPGGGAVAALSAALSAALIGMVTSYTTGPKWTDRETRMQALNQEAAELRQRALQLVEEDAAAFSQVGTAYGMSQETEDDKSARNVAIQNALKAAAQPPAHTVDVAIRLVDIADELVEVCNPNIISDVAVAASNARAALEAAIVNIEINEASINAQDEKAVLHTKVLEAQKALDRSGDAVHKVRQKIDGHE